MSVLTQMVDQPCIIAVSKAVSVVWLKTYRNKEAGLHETDHAPHLLPQQVLLTGCDDVLSAGLPRKPLELSGEVAKRQVA